MSDSHDTGEVFVAGVPPRGPENPPTVDESPSLTPAMAMVTFGFVQVALISFVVLLAVVAARQLPTWVVWYYSFAARGVLAICVAAALVMAYRSLLAVTTPTAAVMAIVGLSLYGLGNVVLWLELTLSWFWTYTETRVLASTLVVGLALVAASLVVAALSGRDREGHSSMSSVGLLLVGGAFAVWAVGVLLYGVVGTNNIVRSVYVDLIFRYGSEAVVVVAATVSLMLCTTVIESRFGVFAHRVATASAIALVAYEVLNFVDAWNFYTLSANLARAIIALQVVGFIGLAVATQVGSLYAARSGAQSSDDSRGVAWTDAATVAAPLSGTETS